MLRTLGRRGLCGVPAGGFGHTVEVRSPGFLTLTLNRPEVHNAFSDAMITDLSKTFDALGEMSGLRGLFVRGAGKSFCAGADLDWMKRAAGYTRAQNEADALAISSMIRKIVELPCATVALVHGNAFGGGVGCAHAPATPAHDCIALSYCAKRRLVAACDVAVATTTTTFALSEARLGLIPATISPWVMRKIGAGQAHRYFLTAERFGAARAAEVGLVHEVAEGVEGLDTWAEHFEAELRQNAPTAVAAGKRLIGAVDGREARPKPAPRAVRGCLTGGRAPLAVGVRGAAARHRADALGAARVGRGARGHRRLPRAAQAVVAHRRLTQHGVDSVTGRVQCAD